MKALTVLQITAEGDTYIFKWLYFVAVSDVEVLERLLAFIYP
jgi:hypothetical protein